MKKRCALLIILLILLLVVGVPTGFLMREIRREQASRDLIAAIKAEDTDRALAAIRAGADPNATDLDDRPPSMRKTLHRFWSRLIHPNSRQQRGYHPAALLLLLGEQPGHDDRNDPATIWRTARNDAHRDQEAPQYGIQYVAASENFALLKALIDKGADVNVKDEYSDTPLLFVARWDHLASLRLLIQHGADLESIDWDGYTALDWAAFNGNVEAVQELILKGARVNLRDRKGNTILDHNKSGHDDQRQFMAGCFKAEQRRPAELRGITREQFEAIMAQDRKAERQIEQLLRKAGAKTGKELDIGAATPKP